MTLREQQQAKRIAQLLEKCQTLQDRVDDLVGGADLASDAREDVDAVAGDCAELGGPRPSSSSP